MKAIALITLLIGWISPVAAACTPVAELLKFEGQISIKPAGKVLRLTPKTLPYPLCRGDELHTFAGKALARSLPANDRITLDANSVLRFKTPNSSAIDQGRALYEVQKRSGGRAVQVATRLSVIGVKGTRFLLTDSGTEVDIALDEGRVEIAPTQGPVKLFRATDVQAEFDAYRREGERAMEQQKQEFEAYRQEMAREFIAYVRQISLSAGQSLSLREGEAISRAIDPASRQNITSLQDWSTQP